jgi:hypothetical protein
MGSTVIPLSWPTLIAIIAIAAVVIICHTWKREDKICSQTRIQYRGMALRQDNLIIDEHYLVMNVGVSPDKYVIIELDGKLYPEDIISRQFVAKFQLWYLPYEGDKLLVKPGNTIKLNSERHIELVS